MTALGADGTGSNVSTLKAYGVTFISRYTSEQSWALTPSEAKTLSDAGISIVSNYEHYTTDYAGGFSQGATNAHTALRVATACGMPSGRPIYFSVDTDVSPSNSSLHEYFRGACSVLGAAQVGVYASTGVCEALKAAGLVTWTWRTMSTGWTGGAGTPSEFNVEQTGYFSSTYDRDIAETADFGQWKVGQAPTPSTGGTDMATPFEVWDFKNPTLDNIDMRQRLVNAEVNSGQAKDNVNELLKQVADLAAVVAAIKAKVGA